LINASLGISSVTTLLNCSPAFKYPKIKDAFTCHFVCPISQAEAPMTAGDFNEASNTIFPETFIENVPFNLDNCLSYAKSSDPDSTKAFYSTQKRIGIAIDFSKWMILNSSNNGDSNTYDTVFSDWNLDSDRGYGYKNRVGLFDMDRFEFDSEVFVWPFFDINGDVPLHPLSQSSG
jgi:hypothetical protein